jgi:HlyD family secretion protein
MKRTRVTAVAVLGIVAAGVAVAKWPRTEAVSAGPSVPTAAVKATSFDVVLRLSGVLQAAKAAPIVNWAQQTQIVWVLPDGARVKPGDVVMKTNVANAKKEAAEAERQAADATEQGRTQIEEARRRLQNATTGLQKAKDDLRLVQLQSQAAIEKAAADVDFNQEEVNVAKGEQAKYERLAADHLVPASRLDTTGDEVRRKDFALAKAQRDLAQAKQDAEANEKVKQLEVDKAQLELESAEAGLKQMQADIDRARALQGIRLEEANQQVEDCEIHSDLAGMLLLETTWEMGERKLRVGDQIWEGQRVASIIDPRKMLVQCDVSEADISRVRVGQSGTVRVPAIGNKVLQGTVQSIDNLAQERFIWEGGTPGKRVFNVVLTLTDGDERLRPGMSGTVEIAVDEARQCLAVPAESLFEKGGKAIVYCQRRDGFEEVPVKVTRRSEMEAAVECSLKPGEKVACERPPAACLATAKGRKR